VNDSAQPGKPQVYERKKEKWDNFEMKYQNVCVITGLRECPRMWKLINARLSMAKPAASRAAACKTYIIPILFYFYSIYSTM
jgi:hypothetical protein